MVVWLRTSLNTAPAVIEMADTDRRPLAIAAGEIITAVSANIVNLVAPSILIVGPVETAVLNATLNGAIVTIQGLTRGIDYELSTVFTAADGEIWTKTTLIKCVS